MQGKLQKPGLFGDYMHSASCQYKYESPMTVSEILCTLSGLLVNPPLLTVHNQKIGKPG